ncbi:dynamin family protein [Caldibacillus thermoamylovorans]
MLAVENNIDLEKKDDRLEYYKIICSLPYENHPIFLEKEIVRKAYIKLLQHYAKQDIHYQKYSKPIAVLYEHRFNIQKSNEDQNSSSIVKFIKEVRRIRWKFENNKLHFYSYKYLFFAHYLLLMQDCVTIDHPFVISTINKQNLGIHRKDAENIVNFTNALKARNFETAKNLLNKKKLQHLFFFFESYKKQVEISEATQKRYLIVGTMSSGKTTFLNALIGQEICPSRNEACTSKIFTYVHRPYIEHFIVQHNETELFECIIDAIKQRMETLNEDALIKHVRVEGKLSKLWQLENRIVLIDTPGTNNSMNRNHEEVTFKAIRSEQYDKIFYLINATQLGTDDDQRLLRYVKEYIANHDNKQIIFIVNKADEIDQDGNESLEKLLQNTKIYLEQNGFESPNIILMSAYVSNLCQKVLNGESLTRREQSEFDFFYEYFAEKDQDLTKYATQPHTVPLEIPNDRREITVKSKTYYTNRVYKVLQHSGFYQLKSYM